MSNRVGKITRKINKISPTEFRPTKEMLEKYEKYWLPLRKKKTNSSTKKKTKSSKSKSNSPGKKNNAKVVKGQKRTWVVRDN